MGTLLGRVVDKTVVAKDGKRFDGRRVDERRLSLP
jgi:hypothetical protein